MKKTSKFFKNSEVWHSGEVTKLMYNPVHAISVDFHLIRGWANQRLARKATRSPFYSFEG